MEQIEGEDVRCAGVVTVNVMAFAGLFFFLSVARDTNWAVLAVGAD